VLIHGFAVMSTFVLPLPQGSFQSSFEKHWAEDVTLLKGLPPYTAPFWEEQIAFNKLM